MIQGKIYKILSKDDNYFYIGSTTRTLEIRFKEHKKQSTTKLFNAYLHFNSIQWNNVDILLLEECICNTKHELHIKEAEYIFNERNNTLCLNKRLPVLSDTIKSDRYMENLRHKIKIKREISNRPMEKQYAYWANRIKLEEQEQNITYC